MEISVREVGANDYDDARLVWSWVYEGTPPGDHRSEPREGQRAYLLRAKGDPAAACRTFPYRIARGQATLEGAGVASVATLAEYRTLGVGSRLMEELLRMLRAEGQPLALLYGFRPAFYRRQGYEVCGWRWRIQAPADRLPKLDLELPARRIDPAEVSVLAQAYEPFVRSRSGSAIRSREQWETRMGQRPPMIYAVGDPIEAYAWTHLGNFWEELRIGEIAWSTLRGYISILALLRGLCINMTHMVWCEPPDSLFLTRYFDQLIDMKMERETMFRVVDVPQALRRLKPDASGSFSFELGDDLLPENRGPRRVAFGPDGVEVEPGGEPDFRLDVRPFAQALLGQPSLEDLARAGLVQVLRPEGFDAARRLLSPLPVVCMDFF